MPNIKIKSIAGTIGCRLVGAAKIRIDREHRKAMAGKSVQVYLEEFENFVDSFVKRGTTDAFAELTVKKYENKIAHETYKHEEGKKVLKKAVSKEISGIWKAKRQELSNAFHIIQLFEIIGQTKSDQEKANALQEIGDALNTFKYYPKYSACFSDRYKKALKENNSVVSSGSKESLDGYNKVKSADERWNQLWDSYMNVTATHSIKDPEVVSAKEALDSFLKGLTDPIYESSKAKYENRLKERVVYLEDIYFQKELDRVEYDTALSDEQQFQKLESLEEEIKNSVTSRKNVYETRRSNLQKEIKSSLAIKKIQDILGDTFDKMGNSLLNQALNEKNRKKADKYIKEVEDVLEDIVVLSIRDSYKAELAKAKTEVNLIPKTQALIDDEKVLESIDKLYTLYEKTKDQIILAQIATKITELKDPMNKKEQDDKYNEEVNKLGQPVKKESKDDLLEKIDKLCKELLDTKIPYINNVLSNIQNLMINLPIEDQNRIHNSIDNIIEEIVKNNQDWVDSGVYQLVQSGASNLKEIIDFISNELERIINFVSNETLKEELLEKAAKLPVEPIIEEVDKLGQPVKKESKDDLLEKIDKLCKALPDKKIPYIEEDLSYIIQNLMINLPIEDQNRIQNLIDNKIKVIVESEQDWLEFDGYQLFQSDIDELKRIIDFVSNEPLKEELFEKVAKFPVESIEEVNKESSPEMAPMPQEPPIKQGTPLNPNEDLEDTVNKMTSTLNSGVPSFTRENANDSDVKKGNTQSIGNLVKIVKSIQKINFNELPDAELNEIYDSIESVMRPFRDLNDCLTEVTDILNERKVENSATVEEVDNDFIEEDEKEEEFDNDFIEEDEKEEESDNDLSSQENAPVEAPIKNMYDVVPPVDYIVGPENWRSYFEESNNSQVKENEEIKTVDIHTLPDDSNLVPNTSKEDITKACIDNVWNRINQANTMKDCENLMDIIDQNAASNVIPEYDAMILRNTVQQIAMSLEEPAKRR